MTKKKRKRMLAASHEIGYFTAVKDHSHGIIKGVQKNVPFSKFESRLLARTVCPKRLSFSQFGVLMSRLNCEKENFLGQTVLVRSPLSNFEKEGTFLCIFIYLIYYCNIKNMFNPSFI